jgi:hypothetical protein
MLFVGESLVFSHREAQAVPCECFNLATRIFADKMPFRVVEKSGGFSAVFDLCGLVAILVGKTAINPTVARFSQQTACFVVHVGDTITVGNKFIILVTETSNFVVDLFFDDVTRGIVGVFFVSDDFRSGVVREGDEADAGTGDVFGFHLFSLLVFGF